MQSECLAVSPNLICSYAWKTPASRPALLERDRLGEEAGVVRSIAPRNDHPSLSWKAYLVLRECQHLASDLTEAFFARKAPALQNSEPGSPVLVRGQGGGEAQGRGLLAPVLSPQPEITQALAA